MGPPALDGVYAAISIDAIVVEVRDGQVANQPIYAAITKHKSSSLTARPERPLPPCGPGPRARSVHAGREALEAVADDEEHEVAKLNAQRLARRHAQRMAERHETRTTTSRRQEGGPRQVEQDPTTHRRPL